MNEIMNEIVELQSISRASEYLGLAKPRHSLITAFNHKDIDQEVNFVGKSFVNFFYIIEYKKCKPGSFRYGKTSYDFDEGSLMFIAPGQVLTVNEWTEEDDVEGWSLMFHPDLIRKSPLGLNISNYSFFSYETNEALHISDDEKSTITGLRDKILQEYSQNIDRQSQKLIVTSIELMLDYCLRYYDRQFFTRENLNKDIVTRFENLLKTYYDTNKPLEQGLPSVKYCGERLNMSPNYFSDLLKKETGRNAQTHIHLFVIERAKTQLLNSGEPISHIAYDLGFKYPQNLSKLFKKKTGVSPSQFRAIQ